MQFNNEGISLRYGTEDSPAPDPLVQAGTEIALTVEVQPADASNDVEVRYRVNEGPTETVGAKWLWNDPSGKSQYFMAHLPAFEVGDTIEYTPICRCAGRQVPSPGESQEFASSFRVVGTAAEPAQEAAPPSGEPEPFEAEAVEELASSSRAGEAEDESARGVAASPTGEPEPVETDMAALSELLDTSPITTSKRGRDTFINLYAEHGGPTERFWDEVRELPEFQEASVVEDLRFTLQLGALTGNNVPLVRALQGLGQDGTLRSTRELAKLDADAWSRLIESEPGGQPVEIPQDVLGETRQEKVANYVDRLVGAVEEVFPTAFVTKALAEGPQIDPTPVREVISQNPHLDPSEPLPGQLDWSGIEADEPKAKADMDKLRREIRMFPEFDYQEALAKSNGAASLTNPIRQGVARVLANAAELDLRNTHIRSYLDEHGQATFADVDEEHQPAVAAQLDRIQRVFQVTPKAEHIEALMGEGLDSAFRISEQPRKAFVEKFSTQLGGEARAAEIYRNAEHKSGALLNLYTSLYQMANDVAPAAVNAGDTAGLVKRIPNWTTLFGRLDFCDCEHCRSVYSPAAYFVDLLQFLNPEVQPGGSGKKPLEVLREHRPDLEHIILTCENTNTPLPYVDLVNEVLESYVALGTLDDTVAKDTSGISAAELSVNPQYTNDTAYTRLQNAVYPFSLPFQRPVEVARAYLEHLGSSRHQVMKTFQKDHLPAAQRAIDCEYLGITAEEYKILTHEDFSGAEVPLSPTHEFFGYDAKTVTEPYVRSWENWGESPRLDGWHDPEDLQLVGDFMGLGHDQVLFINRTGGGGRVMIADFNSGQVPAQVRYRENWGEDSLLNGWHDDEDLQLVGDFMGLGHDQVLFINRQNAGDGRVMIADFSGGQPPAEVKYWENWGQSPLLDGFHDDLRDLQLVGDFMGLGHDQVLFINHYDLHRGELVGGRVMILDFSGGGGPRARQVKYREDWGESPLLEGWHDAGDLQLVGDFMGLGHDQVLFINRQNAGDGRVMIADFSGGQPPAQVKYKEDWGESPVLNGWHDPEDLQLVGDFMGLGYNQVLFVNRTGGGGRVMIADFSSGNPPAQVRYWENWGQSPLLEGWHDPEDLQLVGDFMGLDHDQVLFVNRTGGGGRVMIVGYLRHWQEYLLSVPEFLQRTGILYADLIELLKTRFLNPNKTITLDAPGSGCDLSETKIKNLLADKGATLEKVHRFIRLSRKLGWSIRDVDKAMTALQAPDIDKNLCQKLAQVKWLQVKLNQPLPQLLSLWDNIDTRGDDALYLKLFQNRAVLNPVDDDFELEEDRSELKTANEQNPAKISDNVPTILAALRVSAKDLAAIRYDAELAGDAAELNLKNLSKLYRYTVLARALGLSIDDLIILKKLTDGKPFQEGSTAETVQFVEKVRKVRHSGFTVPQLNYLYRPFSDLPTGIAPPQEQVALLVKGLQEGLRKIAEETPAATDPSGDLRDSLSRSVVNQQLSDALNLDVDTTELLLETILKARVDAAKPAIADFLALIGDATSLDLPLQSYFLLHKVALLLNTFGMTAEEVAYLSAHGADFAGVDPLDPTNGSKEVPFDLNKLPLVSSDFKPALFNQWERLVDLFTLRDSLPHGEVRLIDVFRAARSDRATWIGVLEKVAAATGWDRAELEYLSRPEVFDLVVNDKKNDFTNEAKLRILQECLALSRRLGVPTRRLFSWASGEPDAAQARDVVSTVKAKYDEAQWLAVGKSLNDALRERQKAALIDYVLAEEKIRNQGITDSEQLFEYFLIDVNMSACMNTSRIKQAISSVQLFVQRCLMNLEPQVSPTAIDAERWKWMKNYRVWEANRKVFLYPENWIEPELRDDKSAFFEALETELLQNDLTTDTVETAFLNYLENLDEVARLEICGMYHQQETEDNETTDVLHVFGRTPATPHIYYYRRLLNGSTWTPWEKVNLSIEFDHLIPVVYNRRLYLFWPLFEKKTRRPTEGERRSNLPPVGQDLEYWEIKLAWSEYKHNKWSPRQVSSSFIQSPKLELRAKVRNPLTGVLGPEETFMDALPDPQHHTFKVRFTQTGDLNIAARVHTWGVETYIEQPLAPVGGSPYYDTTRELGYFELAACSSYVVAKGESLGESTYSLQNDLPKDDVPLWSPREDPKGWSILITPKDSIIEAMMFGQYKGNTLELVSKFTFSFSLHPPLQGLQTEKLLNSTPTRFRLLYPPPYAAYYPFSYQDQQRIYFVHLRKEQTAIRPRFAPHYHPYICEFIKALNRKGIPGLLTLANQEQDNPNVFRDKYQPALVHQDYPQENVAFEHGEAYSVYNWELFFHAPLLIATKLSKDQRYEEAQRWFHYIFDPTDGDSAEPSPKRYWKVLPFHEDTEEGRIQILLEALADPAGDQTIKDTMNLEVTEWLKNPFQPHRIARLRLAAYQKAVVMKYVDNLIAWGDQLFGQDTIESINEATQLYVLAQNILGPRPERLPERKLAVEEIWVEDELPTGATTGQPGAHAGWWYGEGWNWVDDQPKPFSGTKAHKSPLMDPRATNLVMHQHHFEGATKGLTIDPGDHLFAYIYLSTEHVPNTVMLQWKVGNDEKSWYHRAYWGAEPAVLMGNERHMGPLPDSGKWVRLEVPAHLVGLEKQTINGMSFSLFGGSATWDRAGKRVEPTYKNLQSIGLDDFANVRVRLENEFPFSSSAASENGSGANRVLDLGSTLYFCIPQNDQLLKYWDTVADRLFKIRHCMNIEGVARQLPLFEPPIDPALLVRAAAAGIDLSSALRDIAVPLPHYRFSYMLQKAQELCAELKSLGGALLSALEKRDAEKLSNLRASHETTVLKAARSIKEQQLGEATTTLEGLQKTKEGTQIRYNFYKNVQFINDSEAAHLQQAGVSAMLQAFGQMIEMGAAAAHTAPDAYTGGAGLTGSPLVFTHIGGGTKAAAGLQAFGRAMNILASLISAAGSMSATMGGYQRRADDWKLQENLAAIELEQIEKQILAAQIRASIAQRELDNHDKQIENAEEVEEFLRDKYTNQELYDWMVSQISSVFFQSYRLAYDAAKRAERTYRFERGLKDSNFIQFGYWDNLKKGLMAGERLYLDLKRLEMAHMDQNRREYEITKQVSLVLHDPLALIALKETGRCLVRLPEELFDTDYPGHYMRRIKSISLTIPAVTGRYTSINCTLTLLKNKIRTDDNAQSDYKEYPEGGDSRFAYDFATVQSIAMSHAKDDSGMFELNFRDERYLPFEGAGVVSEWRIDLPRDCNAFDFDTISDVIIKLNYTARDGGDLLRKNAIAAASMPPKTQQEATGAPDLSLPPQENLYRMFSAKHEFSGEWHRFLHPTETAEEQRLHLELGPERFPFQYRGRTIQITGVDLFVVITDERTVAGSNPPKTYRQAYKEGNALKVLLTPAKGNPEENTPENEISLVHDPNLDDLPHGRKDYEQSPKDPGMWMLKVREADIPSVLSLPPSSSGRKHLDRDAIEDVYVVCCYSVT